MQKKDGAKVADTEDGVVEFFDNFRLLDALNQGVVIEGLRYSSSTKKEVSVARVPLYVIDLQKFGAGTPFMFKIDTSEWKQAVFTGVSCMGAPAVLNFIVRDNKAKYQVSVLRFTVEQLAFKDIRMTIKFNSNEPYDVAFIDKMVRQAGGFNNL